MGELDRLVVVGAVVLLASAAAWAMRRARRTVRAVPPEFGPFPAVLFFGSETCASCRPVLERLEAAGVVYRGFTWEDHPAAFETLKIDEVPRLLGVDADGQVRMDERGEAAVASATRFRRFQ